MALVQSDLMLEMKKALGMRLDFHFHKDLGCFSSPLPTAQGRKNLSQSFRLGTGVLGAWPGDSLSTPGRPLMGCRCLPLILPCENTVSPLPSLLPASPFSTRCPLFLIIQTSGKVHDKSSFCARQGDPFSIFASSKSELAVS